MRPDDVALLRQPSSPTLRGDLLVVAVARPDADANEYHSALQRIPLDGGVPRPWTWGAKDGSPRLSPDGRWLAFLRKAGGEDRIQKQQLHVMPSDGGDARCVTTLHAGVSGLAWAPDSRRIAFTTRVAEPGRYGTSTDEWPGAPESDAEAPRRLTRMDYRLDDVGYLVDQHARLYALDLGTALDPDAELPEPVELTDGRCDVGDAVWTPDGQYVVVTAPRDLGVEETVHSDIYAVPAAGGTPVLLAQASGWTAMPTVADDGTVVYFGTEHDGPGDAEAENSGLWAVPFASGEAGTPRRLTDVETIDCETMAGPPIVTDDGVLVAMRNRGAIELRRVPMDAVGVTLAELPVLAGEHGSVKSFTADAGRIAAVVSTPDSPGEVVLIDGDQTTTLTDFATPLQAAGLRPLTELDGTSPDGYPVHGWLVLPEGPGPHPVLLCIHGGPFMYHGWGFYDEAQVYAAAGYAVVLPNR